MSQSWKKLRVWWGQTYDLINILVGYIFRGLYEDVELFLIQCPEGVGEGWVYTKVLEVSVTSRLETVINLQ